MTKHFITVLAAITFASFSIGTALPTAYASAPGMTVRITDHAAVEASIGSCSSGYMLRDESAAGSRPVAFHGGEATLDTRIGSSMTAPMFYCAGSRIGFPQSGVEIEMH